MWAVDWLEGDEIDESGDGGDICGVKSGIRARMVHRGRAVYDGLYPHPLKLRTVGGREAEIRQCEVGGKGAHAAFRANVQSDAIRLAADEDRNRLYANVCFTKGGEQVRPEKARPAGQQHARPIVVLVINVRSGC